MKRPGHPAPLQQRNGASFLAFVVPAPRRPTPPRIVHDNQTRGDETGSGTSARGAARLHGIAFKRVSHQLVNQDSPDPRSEHCRLLAACRGPSADSQPCAADNRVGKELDVAFDSAWADDGIPHRHGMGGSSLGANRNPNTSTRPQVAAHFATGPRRMDPLGEADPLHRRGETFSDSGA